MLLAGGVVSADPTDLTVRVVARNAQYVGDLVDGALITITDARSGEVLAQGTTVGKPGEAKDLTGVAGKQVAAFSTTLDIDRPRQIQVSAYGPLAGRYSAGKISATQWIVPGKHLTGLNGWTLEMPGLLVSPDLAASSIALSKSVGGVRIGAEVLLMCGCPIDPDSRWKPKDYEVAAIVTRGSETVAHLPLRYAGVSSEFETEFIPQLAGVYVVDVYAYAAGSGNTGVGTIELTIRDE